MTNIPGENTIKKLSTVGALLRHRFIPTESPRVVREAQTLSPRIASEVGTNLVAEVRMPGENVLVKGLTNTQPRHIQPIALSGSVVLPVRGERVFELSPELHSQFTSRIRKLSRQVSEPSTKEGYLGYSAPAFKARSGEPAASNRLVTSLAKTSAQARNLLTSKPAASNLVLPKTPQLVQALPKQLPVIALTQPTLQPTAVQEPPAPSPVSTAASLPEIPQLRLALNEFSLASVKQALQAVVEQLNHLSSDLKINSTEQSMLLFQRISGLEKVAREQLGKELSTQKAAHPEIGSEINKLWTELPASLGDKAIDPTLDTKDLVAQLINWQSQLAGSIKKYNLILGYIRDKQAREAEEELKKQKVPASQETFSTAEAAKKVPEPLSQLPTLAEKVIETSLKRSPATYVPINLPTPPRPVVVIPAISAGLDKGRELINNLAKYSAEGVKEEQVALPAKLEVVEVVKAERQAPAVLTIPVKAEVIETQKQAQATTLPTKATPLAEGPIVPQEAIAKEVAKQLGAEKQKLEEELKEKLTKEITSEPTVVATTQAGEQQPGQAPIQIIKAEEGKGEAPLKAIQVPQVQEVQVPSKLNIFTLESEEKKAQPAPKPEETKAAGVALEQKPPSPEDLKRAASQAELEKVFTQTEGIINNLALDKLSSGEREQLIGRLRSLQNQAEVMRQYDSLKYQKEKARLNSEAKILIEEANKKVREKEEKASLEKQAETQHREAAADKKAQVAAEVKELVEREKARRAYAPDVVPAQPAYGKMIPPKVSFPNVINGIVRDNNGLLLSGVIMIIKDASDDPVRALKSNKIGQFVISTPLPNGTYKIELEKEGYDFNIVQVEVAGEIMHPIEIRSQ